MKAKTVIFLSLGAAAVIGGGIAVSKLKSFQENLNVTQTTKVTVTSRLLGIPTAFRLDITPTVKNPTKASLTLTKPYIEMRLDEKAQTAFASSDISDKVYDVNPFSSITFDPISININLTSGIKDILGFAQNAIKTGKVAVFLKTVIIVNKNSAFPIRSEKNEAINIV